MKKYHFLFLFTLIITGYDLYPQVLPSEKEAFATAKELSRPIMLVFAGSDWCVPCMKFDKEVLHDSDFVHFANQELVILKAEFPQKKKLPKDIVTQNEKLADKYNPQGLFPHILLLRPDGSVISTLDYQRQTAEEFVRLIEKNLAENHSINEGLHLKSKEADPLLKEYHTETMLMGCGFGFTIVDPAETDRGWELVQESIEEVKRIEELISEWSDTTEIGILNLNAGIKPVKVSAEVYELIRRSLAISELTQGAFDISFGGAGKLWRFDPRSPVIPDSEAVKQALQSVSYQKIELLDSDRVYLEQPGMMIGFGAIGKGYAAERVKQMLIAQGVKSGVINASGDLTAWGVRADGSPWKVGIADPADPSRVLLWLPVTDEAVATSGNYEKYVMIGGERYGHILDPRTGYPVKGIKSVTVISPSAELSDALATAVFVMGVDTGMDFIEQLQEVHCIIIDDLNVVHYSKGIRLN